MKPWMHLWIACLFSMAIPGYTENMESDEIPDLSNFRKKLEQLDWLPFKMAIPEHYVALPAARDKNLGLSDGFFCGERTTIENLWQQNEKEPSGSMNPISGCFFVSFSWDVAQRGANNFSVSDQVIRSTLEKQGASSIKIRNLIWNEYPVKSVEAELPGHTHCFIAWVGLNAGGEVAKIRYLCPKPTSFFDKEIAIWDHFLQNSKGISQEEFLKTMNQMFPKISSLHESP